MAMNWSDQRSQEFFEQASRVIPGGVHSPVRAFRKVGRPPLFIKQAKGNRIWDVDGNEWIDYCMSWGPMILGHRHPSVRRAVEEALERSWSSGYAEPYSLELANLVTAQLPWVEKIRFVTSGTEAVMSALRVARAATSKNKIIKFDGCYHGHSDQLLVRAGSGLAEQSVPDSAGVPKTISDLTIVCPLHDEAFFEQTLEMHHRDLAAVIIEPLPANNGLLPLTPSFLNKIATLTKQSGALLIFDEVISGFRTGFGGMAEQTGIRPDLVTFGKILGGGFPVGAYGGKSHFMNLVAPMGNVYQAGTLSGNPIATIAGLATLQELLKTRPYLALEKAAQKIADQSFQRLKIIQRASLFWIALKDPTEFGAFYLSMLDQGIYLPPSPFEVSMLSTAHLEDDSTNRLIEALRQYDRQ